MRRGVGLGDYGPRAGEVLRIDPATNEVTARIPTPGYAGEFEVGAGAVWVLGHPEYTDETRIAETSLHRIDPATDELVATPMREEGVPLGGAILPRAIASDDRSVWIGAFAQSPPFEAAGIRVTPRRIV